MDKKNSVDGILDKIDRVTGPGDFHWTDPEFLEWERSQFLHEMPLDLFDKSDIPSELLPIASQTSYWESLDVHTTRYMSSIGKYGACIRPMIWLVSQGNADPYRFFGWEAEQGDFKYNSVEPDPVFGYRYADPVEVWSG